MTVKDSIANKSALQLQFLSAINLHITLWYAKVPESSVILPRSGAVEFLGASQTHPQVRNGGSSGVHE